MGIKRRASGEELVLVRDFRPRVGQLDDPATTFPVHVPSSAEVHRSDLPELPHRASTRLDPYGPEVAREILKTTASNRNALRKVYISRSIRRDMAAWATSSSLLPYRVQPEQLYYTSVASTLGIVESVVKDIQQQS